jgi:hypothetical protein
MTSSVELGQVLRRKPAADTALPKNLKLIGVAGNSWVGQNHDVFSSPILLAPHELAAAYVGVDGAPVPAITDAQAWRDLHNSNPKWLDKSVNAANAAAKAQAKAAETIEAKLQREAAEQDAE